MEVILRPFRPTDAEAIAALTLAAIRVTGRRAYSPTQVAAWAARYSVQRLLDSAAQGDAIVVAADAGDCPIAYAVMEADGHLDMLYSHPDHAGRGLAGQLLAEAESRARSAGITNLFTEASELARPVFQQAGYAVLHRRDFAIGPAQAPVSIHNCAMEKRLG